MKTLWLSLIGLIAWIGPAIAQEKKGANFGALTSPTPAEAKERTLAWLKQRGQDDPATLRQVEQIWKQDRTVLDRVVDILALGRPEIGPLLAEARDPLAPAPTSIPDIFKCGKTAVFVRANVGLAYARALSMRRVHEEALDVFKTVTPEDTVDPASYFFHRAVSEYALLLKKDAEKTIGRLLEDVAGGPERYQTVAALMLLDMQTWKDKDLAAIARKMENVERRLELARGGPQTQRLQKEIIYRLDELIKSLERPPSPPGPPGPPKDGPGTPTPGADPTRPLDEPALGGPTGKGQVDIVRIKKLQEQWKVMPYNERVHAIQELTRGMPQRYREAIETYFRNLAK